MKGLFHNTSLFPLWRPRNNLTLLSPRGAETHSHYSRDSRHFICYWSLISFYHSGLSKWVQTSFLRATPPWSLPHFRRVGLFHSWATVLDGEPQGFFSVAQHSASSLARVVWGKVRCCSLVEWSTVNAPFLTSSLSIVSYFMCSRLWCYLLED